MTATMPPVAIAPEGAHPPDQNRRGGLNDLGPGANTQAG